METVILKILDNTHNKIDNIKFIANNDLSFLKDYKDFAYNVDFYNGIKKAITKKIGVSAMHISNDKMLITFSGFTEKLYSKAVITSLSAYNSNDEFYMQLEHEITYTFSN